MNQQHYLIYVFTILLIFSPLLVQSIDYKNFNNYIEGNISINEQGNVFRITNARTGQVYSTLLQSTSTNNKECLRVNNYFVSDNNNCQMKACKNQISQWIGIIDNNEFFYLCDTDNKAIKLKNYHDDQDAGVYISTPTKRMYYAAFGLIIALFVFIALVSCMTHGTRIIVRILKTYRR